MKRLSITYKILSVLVMLSIIPVMVLGFITISNIKLMGSTATKNVQLIGQSAIADSTDSLTQLGELYIQQIALDVAKQLEVYIISHPDMTVEDIQADDYFKSLAVQPVGDTGYTAVTDVDTLVCRFHSQEKIVNMDLSVLAEKLPGFWAIMSATRGGVPSEGFYDWVDPDGKVRSKYMYIAIADARTADGVQFSVAATTYIDEFSAPAARTEEKISGMVSKIVSSINNAIDSVKKQAIVFVVVIAVFVLLVGLVLANSITTPLKKLTEAGNKIANGKLDTLLPEIRSNDEIMDLSNAMNLVVGALRYLKKEKKK